MNQTDPTADVWIDGDPLMEAIASAVWEHCERGGNSTVFDDPRNIAAVAAAVARTAASAVVSPPTDRAAVRDRIADAIRAAACPGDCGKTEEDCAKERIQPFVWHHGKLAGVEGSPEQFADAVLAVLGAQTDRAAVLREAADAVAEMDTDPSTQFAAEQLRRLAVEAHDTGTQRAARCPHGCDVTRCPCLACEAEDTEALASHCDHCKQPGHSFEDCPRADEPSP